MLLNKQQLSEDNAARRKGVILDEIQNVNIAVNDRVRPGFDVGRKSD